MILTAKMQNSKSTLVGCFTHKFSLKVDNVFDTDYEDIVGYAGQERRALLLVNYSM